MYDWLWSIVALLVSVVITLILVGSLSNRTRKLESSISSINPPSKDPRVDLLEKDVTSIRSTLSSNYAHMSERITALSKRVDGLSPGGGNGDNVDIASIKSRLDVVEKTVNVNSGSIQRLSSETNAATVAATAAASKADSAVTAVNSMKPTVSSNQSSIADLSQRVLALETGNGGGGNGGGDQQLYNAVSRHEFMLEAPTVISVLVVKDFAKTFNVNTTIPFLQVLAILQTKLTISPLYRVTIVCNPCIDDVQTNDRYDSYLMRHDTLKQRNVLLLCLKTGRLPTMKMGEGLSTEDFIVANALTTTSANGPAFSVWIPRGSVELTADSKIQSPSSVLPSVFVIVPGTDTATEQELARKNAGVHACAMKSDPSDRSVSVFTNDPARTISVTSVNPAAFNDTNVPFNAVTDIRFSLGEDAYVYQFPSASTT